MMESHAARVRLVALIDEVVAHDARAPEDVSALDSLFAAVARVDAGTYGKCTNCGEDIGDELLLQMPAISLCTSCASDDHWRPFEH